MSEHLIENETKAMRIADCLRADIISGVFEAGTRITTKEIGDRYGASNVPVREALRTLESEKLLEINAYKGATILNINEEYISSIYELQRSLQLLIYEKALPALTEEVFSRLKEINEEIGSLRDTEDDRRKYLNLDKVFHDIILQLSSNVPAVELYTNYYKLLNSIRRTYLPEYERVREAYREHISIIAALEARDLLKLRFCIDAHSIEAERNLMLQFKSRRETE
ncbi:MAG: GntR family transcriptional regulator [Firmicutes bacterium]|nr:GntR family transcriptional regulator [Bacillota bacterium]